MRGWLTVLKKEIREFTRDRRLLTSALLGPVFLEVLLIALFGYLERSFSEAKSQKILVENADEGAAVVALLSANPALDIQPFPGGMDAEQAVRRKEARAVLSFPKGFAQMHEQRKNPEFFIVFDPSETTSEIASRAVAEVAEHARTESVKQRIRERGLDVAAFEPFRVAKRPIEVEKAFGGEWLIGFLPYLIVIWAFYGGFSIVADLVAGEKERGSLETLLITPISRSAIAFGKFMALALVSFMSCVSAISGVVIMGVLNLPLTQNLFKSGFNLSFLSFVALVFTILPLVILFAGLLLSVSTYARNQREVQGYLSLLSFVVLVPAIFSQFIGYTDFASSRWVSLVPVLNTATVIREALLNKVDVTNLLITSGVGIFLAALGLFGSIRLFNRESVLLRS